MSSHPSVSPENGGKLEGAAVAPCAEELINILLVDDEPKNLVALETVLDNPDYRLVSANSG